MGAACERPTEMQHIPYVLIYSLFITSLPYSSPSFFLSFFLSFSFLSFSSFLSFIFLLNLNIDFCGSGWCSRYSDLLWTGRSGDRIPVVVRFSAPRPHQARGPPSPLYNGYRVSLPAAKAADAWRSTHPM